MVERDVLHYHHAIARNNSTVAVTSVLLDGKHPGSRVSLERDTLAKPVTPIETLDETRWNTVQMLKNSLGKEFIVKTQSTFPLDSHYNSIEQEYWILWDLRDHPNIVQTRSLVLTEYTDGEYGLGVLLEKVPGVPLYKWIKEQHTPDQVHSVIDQILDSVEYCHAKNIVHGDIHEENILITPDNKIKLIDFSISVRVDGDKPFSRPPMGIVEYAAPELLSKKIVSKKTDAYAVGVLLLGIFSGRSRHDSMANDLDENVYRFKRTNTLLFSDHMQQILTIPQRNTIESIVFYAMKDNPDERLSIPIMREIFAKTFPSTPLLNQT